MITAQDLLGIWTVVQEASSESLDGQVAVAEVIQTRMRLKIQSDGTVEGTVLKPYQFSGWNTKDPNRIRSIRASRTNFLKAAISWFTAELTPNRLTDGATHYFNPDVVPEPAWARGIVPIRIIGHHKFYKLNG